MADVRGLCERYHGYGSGGSYSSYAFGVYEDDRMVAAYAWQPPAMGASTSVCPEMPQGVLALSRMVAVPRSERRLNHISKPLRYQMSRLIDRGRWPVLVTYHDEGQGHTGHVYKCSGWRRTLSRRVPFYVDALGARRSPIPSSRGLTRAGTTVICRWEHWICEPGQAAQWMSDHGWRRVAVPGRVWRSGNPAYTFERVT